MTPGGLLDLQTSGGISTAGPAAHPAAVFHCRASTACPSAKPSRRRQRCSAWRTSRRPRYWRPNLAALRDPVVTCNGDRLRFESFSGCCGVYARLDVLDEGMDGTALDRGTTDVDVNNDLRLALTPGAW